MSSRVGAPQASSSRPETLEPALTSTEQEHHLGPVETAVAVPETPAKLVVGSEALVPGRPTPPTPTRC